MNGERLEQKSETQQSLSLGEVTWRIMDGEIMEQRVTSSKASLRILTNECCAETMIGVNTG